tara:strand:- start:1259 stop:1522 length:264 start_codon:yes stop_codon:yes gene_type:complete
MENYETLLNRFDAVLIENEALKEELKRFKTKEVKELKKEVEEFKRLYMLKYTQNEELKKTIKELKETIERIKTSRQFERTNNINLTK